MKTLAERQLEYEEAYNTKLIKRVPVIIRLNGRNFVKLTKDTTHPFCKATAEIMATTLINLCKQIDGVVFGYQFFDEITLILQNNQTRDTDPWFNNRCQKICSVSASIATYEFNNYFWNMSNPPPLAGAPLFDSRVFAVPDLNEAINHLVWRQQVCYKSALEKAVFTELANKYGRKKAGSIIYGKNDKERMELLWNESSKEFEADYPTMYRLGVSSYLIPKTEDETFNVWYLDLETGVFSNNRSFLFEILGNGKDVFRTDRVDIIED